MFKKGITGTGTGTGTLRNILSFFLTHVIIVEVKTIVKEELKWKLQACRFFMGQNVSLNGNEILACYYYL